MTRRPFVALLAAFLLVGCVEQAPTGAVRPLPLEMVPATLANGAITLERYAGATDGFNSAGTLSLINEGALFELRRGETLVGTLEVATLKFKADPRKQAVQAQIANQAVTGAIVKLKVEGIDVTGGSSADKVLFLWFGDQMFQLLNLKDKKAKPEELLAELLRAQRAKGLQPVSLSGGPATTRKVRR